ncbi:MAG TPA: xanthine dehydrogenase family protein subunit M [Solirubrobacteraceae bacterium]|nr:xanthine dehydrogenase family protein subunit M [Solirubrobacteraceae bacterium]
MKPAAFAYHRVDSLDEAIERLGELGEDAKVLAGGQSLVPMMNFRLVRPPALVDVSRVAGHDYLERDGDALRIGALTTHAAIEHGDGALDGGFEVLRRAARFVGHYPIRVRGTFGGSLAHADPSAEWCMLAVALDATVRLRGPGGERDVAAADFFLGFFTADLEPGEVVVEVRFPRPWPAAALQEFARRHGDFAIVATVTALDLDDAGRCREARVVVGGVDEIPVRVEEAEQVLAGAEPSAEAFAEAGRAAARAVDPSADVHGSAEYRKELTGVLVRRGLAEAVAHGE